VQQSEIYKQIATQKRGLRGDEGKKVTQIVKRDEKITDTFA